jgi:putative transcriptional regulator
MTEPRHHFPDDVLRAHAVGTAPEATRLAVSCHLAFCSACQRVATEHESFLLAFGGKDADSSKRVTSAVRERLLADLPAQPPRPPAPQALELPSGLPELPKPMLHHLATLPKVAWQRLIPGIRAIDLGFTGVWRARLLAFQPGIPIPRHDHGGMEHTVVFQGGLNDDSVRLEPGDAATMMGGETHRQRVQSGGPCIALIVNEGPPLPLTLLGHVLRRVTRS